MDDESSDAFRDLAALYLSPEDAERWLGLLRPGVRLAHAEEGDEVAGQLGGRPALGAGTDWPTWEGHGPLSFVASLDCAALPPAGLDIDLPGEGTLLFFHFDGQVDDGDALVLIGDRDTWPGARVVYVPAGEETAGRDAPEGIEPYPAVPLTARAVATATGPWHPRIHTAFAPDAPPGWRYDHPVCAQEFQNALLRARVLSHQVGGDAGSVQGPAELEAAGAVLEGRVSPDDPRMFDTVGEWVLLAQFDSDDAASMMWGDNGVLYWLIRRQDLAERRFDRAVFTWQCC